MIGIMIYSGYFRDEYVPAVYIPDFMTDMSWILLLGSPVLILLSCYGYKQKPPAIVAGIVNVFWLIAVIVFCAFVIYGYTLVKDYPLGAEEKADYIASEQLMGINLEDLETCAESDEECPIYIGSDDCQACAEFEKNLIEILEKNHTSIPAYYTNLDRDGEKSETMNAVLKKYQVTSVPALIVVKNEKTIKAYSPEDLEGVADYFKL
ncbi:hypothetical protein NE619_16955 [Anaerovorax odorimutans]|uniref:Thioredoxin domain-containing protein n=2 Tax=Anaerovorax odorimutans TaxID=109327 RepID=A0ABT1RT80_9FIRM|nr:hypothetical protein [Anaerovorax odorimutans]